MKVAVLGAGAMGSALTIPLTDNGNEVRLWGTEYDVEILRTIKSGKEHPRIGVKLENVEICDFEAAVRDADVVLIGVSTDGVIPVFRKLKETESFDAENTIIVTVAKGLLEFDDEILTVPEAIWREDERVVENTVAITGPSIAREVAKKMPTRVVFSSEGGKAAKQVKEVFETDYYGIEVSSDVRGTEITSALKNVYSIAIAWIRGHESAYGVEMSNAKGVIATMAINEIASIIELAGGDRMTAFGLSGFGDLIATFRGGRNGMLGELLGKGLSIEDALEELRRRGVGVIEGYGTARKAFKLIKLLEKDGKCNSDDFSLLKSIHQVLYGDKKVKDVLKELVVEVRDRS